MNRALKHALREGQIVKEDESGEGGLIHTIVRSRGAPAVILRTLGAREFQDIPASELQLVGRILSKHGGLEPGSEVLLRGILDFFGFKRLSAQIRTTLVGILARRYSYVDEIIAKEF